MRGNRESVAGTNRLQQEPVQEPEDEIGQTNLLRMERRRR